MSETTTCDHVDDGLEPLSVDGLGVAGLVCTRTGGPGEPDWSHLNDVSVDELPQWVRDDLNDAAWADRRQLRLLYLSLTVSYGGVCALANYIKELADEELQDYDRSCGWDDACGYDSANRRTLSSRMCGGIPPVTLHDDGTFPIGHRRLHEANVQAVETLRGRMAAAGSGCSRAFMEVSIWDTGQDKGHGCVLVFDRTARGEVRFGFFDSNASRYNRRADAYFREHLARSSDLQYLGPLLPTELRLVERGLHYDRVRSYGLQTDGSCVAWAYHFVYLCIVNPGVPCTDVARYVVLQSLGGPSEPAGKTFLAGGMGLERVEVPSLDGYDRRSARRIYGWMAYVRAHCLQTAKTLMRRASLEDKVRGLRHLLPVASLCAHHRKLYSIEPSMRSSEWYAVLRGWRAEYGRSTPVLHAQELDALTSACSQIFQPLRSRKELGDVVRADGTTVLEHVLPQPVLMCAFMLQTPCAHCGGMVDPFQQYRYRVVRDGRTTQVWHATCPDPRAAEWPLT